MTTTVFSADDGFNGRELWTTDGTPAGTHLLADLWPGGGSGNPGGFTLLDAGHAVFTATDAWHGGELWTTDGTAAGTHLVLDINLAESGFGGSNPSGFTALGEGRTLFTASDSSGASAIWVTDGTAAGTAPLVVPANFGINYLSGPFVALDPGHVLFSASTDAAGTELWITDGSTAGTHLVADIFPGSSGSFPGSSSMGMVALGDGRALFSADDGVHGRELWVSDGTPSGTTLLADLAPGFGNYYLGGPEFPNSSNPGNLTLVAPGRVLFTASDPEHGTELWTSDGTAEGTHLVVDLWTGSFTPPYSGAIPMANSSAPANILPLGNGLALFSADDSVHGREFWVTDGTAANTTLLADIWEGGGSGNPGSSSGYPSYGPPPRIPPGFGPGGSLALGDGRAIFSATDPWHGTELWITDGTTEGTRMVADIDRAQQGFAGSNPSYFAALGDGRVVFTADDGVNGPEPWVTDGTEAGTQPLGNLFPGATGSGASGYVTLAAAPAGEPPAEAPPEPWPLG